ncbi:MFS transporter [Cohnella suwonensis]|uniref:MFS transporter n=1 Tax=Cohnella suwonensis TaxID=696072 RepID=A0ABW0LNS9_9BACL
MSNPTNTTSLAPDRSVSRREGLLIALLGVSVVLVIMNTMMFNFALPDVAKAYELSAVATSWIVTGYSIIFAISSITYSRLSDFVPIHRLLIVGILSLSLAAIIGYFVDSYAMLLAVRFVQASGAGSIPALALVICSRYVPLERRGKAMATIMSAAALGLGLGPVAGGAIVEYLGWHDLFLVTAATLVLVPFFLVTVPREKPVRGSFDALGALLSGVGTTGLLLFLTNHSWIALLGGIAAILLFVVRIRMAASPFVLPALFANRPYLSLSAVGIAAYLCSFSTLYLMPQLLVKQYGLSAIEAGFVIFPGSLLSMLISSRVGRIIDRKGNLPIIRYVPLLVLLAVILFALFDGAGYAAISFIYILLSVGFTFITSSVSNEMSRILPPKQIGSGLGLLQLLQFFSGAFGVAMSATAVGWQKEFKLSHAYSNIYWGLAVIVALSLLCVLHYLRSRSRVAQSVAA